MWRHQSGRVSNDDLLRDRDESPKDDDEEKAKGASIFHERYTPARQDPVYLAQDKTHHNVSKNQPRGDKCSDVLVRATRSRSVPLGLPYSLTQSSVRRAF